jgi:nitroreductase
MRPWHFIVVTDRGLEQDRRSLLKSRWSGQAEDEVSNAGLSRTGHRAGIVVVASDFRWVKAFPVLNDGSALDKMYKENAERILLQSVAAATMSAHLAAAALGYNVWWVTAIGQEKAQKAMKPLLGIPDELSVLDIMCFGPPAKPPYKRWKKNLSDITNWNAFDRSHYMTDSQIDAWVAETRHKVMYRDAQNVD